MYVSKFVIKVRGRLITNSFTSILSLCLNLEYLQAVRAHVENEKHIKNENLEQIVIRDKSIARETQRIGAHCTGKNNKKFS